MFIPMNLCLYVWYGNTFDIAFVTLVQDYFWRIFHSYEFIPDFMNWQQDRQEQEKNLLELFLSPDVQKGQRVITKENNDIALDFDGNFSWGFITKDKVSISECVGLRDMKFQIKKGEFVLIVGSVGCGKTSLLNAICGNMIYLPDKTMKENKGKTLEKADLEKLAHEMGDLKFNDDNAPVRLCGKLAYAEQKAWIENKTIKETILFGETLDEERY